MRGEFWSRSWKEVLTLRVLKLADWVSTGAALFFWIFKHDLQTGLMFWILSELYRTQVNQRSV